MKFKLYEYRSDFGISFKTIMLNNEASFWEHEVELEENPQMYEIGKNCLGDPLVVFDGYNYLINEIIGYDYDTDKLYILLPTAHKVYRKNLKILSTRNLCTIETLE